MPELGGEHVPVEKFHVSELNVRVGQPFGESEEDRAFVDQLRRGKIIGPEARREGDSCGVVVGRRRFLAKKEAGAKFFVELIHSYSKNTKI